MTAIIPSGPQVIIEIGFSGPGTGTALHLDDTSRGRLDTATLGADAIWTDVTRWVASWQYRRGATRGDGPMLRYEAGTATIVLRDQDRRFDPANLAGPYVVGGVTQVVPMRAVRIRAVWAGTAYPLWQGNADNWQVNYNGPTGSDVTLTASDAFAVFASYDRGEQAVPVGAGETTGARINRILDSMSWPAGDRAIAVGDSTVQATTLGGNVLAELQLTADSELGELYVDAEGRLTFRNRLALFRETRSTTPQGTFGDDPSHLAELPYANVNIDYDAASIYNYISVTRVGGTAQVAQDLASQSAYLTRSYSRSDLIVQDDTTVLSYAQALLRPTPELRFSALVIKPQRDGRLWAQALGREIGDRITIVRRPPGGGAPITRDVFIRGMEHVLTERLEWTTTLQLQSASRLSFLVLDDATLGRLDSNTLAY